MSCKAIPDYAKSFKKQYIFLLGLDSEFSHIRQYLLHYEIEEGNLKEKSKTIERLYKIIKKYQYGLKSGLFKDLSEEYLNFEVFLNIEDLEMMVSDYLGCYADFYREGKETLNKKKIYEKNVDKDFLGLRKLIDTLSYEVIK